MKYLPLCALLISSAFADHHEINQLTAEEKAADWTLLFHGKSTENFRNYKKEGLSPKWVVKDGLLPQYQDPRD